MHRKRWTMVFLCLVCFIMTGCAEGQELKYVSFISSTGVDKIGPRHFRLWLVPLSIGETGQQENNAAKNRLNSLIIRDGETAFDIERNMIRETKHRVVFTHARAVVVSERMAKEDLGWFVDTWFRDQQPHSRAYLFVTPSSVKDVLIYATWLEPEVSFPLSFGMENIRFVSNYATLDLIDCLKHLHEPPYNAILPMIQTNMSKSPPTVEYRGTAVIRHGKMVGSLNTPETQGLVWLLGLEKGGSLQFQANGKNTAPSVLELNAEHKRLQVHWVGQHLQVQYFLHLQGTIAQDGTSDDSWSTAHRSSLERKAEDAVQRICQQTITALQKTDSCDALRVGLYVYRHDSSQWHQHASLWDSVFSNAEIRVHVQVTIQHPGLVRRNLAPPSLKGGSHGHSSAL